MHRACLVHRFAVSFKHTFLLQIRAPSTEERAWDACDLARD